MPELTPEYDPTNPSHNSPVQLGRSATSTRPATFYERNIQNELFTFLALSEFALIALAALAPSRNEANKARRAWQLRRAARPVTPTTFPYASPRIALL
ncbi:MAG TPA: hypothetical protein VLH86_03960 [Patescibacteria group bacterium]|nr:hypothetical protein [Patescibacteria group bacterium]